MKQPFTKSPNIRSERGQALVFGAFFMLGLLFVGGLGVDTAHVFLKKSKIQRAADASTMAAITRYADGITETEAIESAAEELAEYNLLEMGIHEDEIINLEATLSINENNVATLSLETDVDVDTFFMKLIPGEQLDKVAIKARSSARRVPAIISLVFDTSGSMDCNGACPEKLQALKDAATTFIEAFQDDLDQVAIIEFNYNAEVLEPMQLIDKEELIETIDDLSTGGWTNIAEGIKLGRLELESTENPEAIKALVLFSDGAPNTLSPNFTDGKYFLDENFPNEDPTHFHYVVEGMTNAVKHPVSLNQICSKVRYCFDTFEYADSRLNVVPGSLYVDRNSQTEKVMESYDISIVEADYAKADGSSVYTIGLGTEDTETSDAYQDTGDGQTLKPILLRRIANDPASKNDPQFPEFPNNSSHPAGIYLQTPDNSELTSLFQAVAQRLKLRLIE